MSVDKPKRSNHSTTIMVDKATVTRLRDIAGSQPLASFLRDLSANYTPIFDNLTEMKSLLYEIKGFVEDMDTAMCLIPGHNDELTRLRNERIKRDRRDAAFMAAAKDSPEYQEWLRLSRKGKFSPISPSFVFDDDDNVVYEDGKPKIGPKLPFSEPSSPQERKRRDAIRQKQLKQLKRRGAKPVKLPQPPVLEESNVK